MTNEITQTERCGNKEVEFSIDIFQDKAVLVTVRTGVIKRYRGRIPACRLGGDSFDAENIDGASWCEALVAINKCPRGFTR